MPDPANRPPLNAPNPTVAGVILAGGRGTRLGGVVKARLQVGGVPLLKRVAEVLAPSVAPLLVATGRFAPEDLRLGEAMIAVPDPEGVPAGPLGGVLAAAAWLAERPEQPRLLLATAVDTPFLPADYPARLLAGLDEAADVAVASCDGQAYPTNALWRVEALAALTPDLERLAPGGLKGVMARLSCRNVAWPTGPDGDPFANVNTPEELAALEARATRQRGVHDARTAAEIGVGKAGQTR